MLFLKKITCLIVLATIGIIHQAQAHSETVAHLTVEYADDGLTIVASLEKRHLSHALKKEAECLPEDMLKICADQYVQKNIAFALNDKEVTISKVSQQLTQTSLIITYQIKFEEPIKKIAIHSDYMIQYNDHSKVKVISRLSAENGSYSLSAKRRKITISL